MMRSRTPQPLPDVKPHSPTTKLDRRHYAGNARLLPIELVAPAVGMSKTFIRRALGVQLHQLTVDQGSWPSGASVVKASRSTSAKASASPWPR